MLGRIVRWFDRRIAGIGPPAQPRDERGAPARDELPATVLARAVSSNGFVRESALHELAAEPRAEAIATLLVRANDWVVQVRSAAAVAIAAHLRDDFVDAWAASLGELDRLRRAERFDCAPLLARIDAFLSAPTRLHRIDAATTGAPLHVRRAVRALQLGAARTEPERAGLLVANAASGDIVMALAAVRAGASLRTREHREAIRGAAAASPHPAIRRAALVDMLRAADVPDTVVGPSDEPAREATIRRFAFDASISVRAVALRAADANLRATLATTARQRLAETPSARDHAAADRRHAVALNVLVELDPDDAAADCAAQLGARGAMLREAAFAGAWRGADAERREALVLSALADPAPRLQRWAARAVARDGLVPAWRDLLAIAAAAPSATRTAAIARALAHGSPWPRLVFLLTIADRDDGIDESLLDAWCRDVSRSFVTPSLAERHELAALWRSVARRLAPSLSAKVAGPLRDWHVLVD